MNTVTLQILFQFAQFFLPHQQYRVIFPDVSLSYTYFPSFQKTIFKNYGINFRKAINSFLFVVAFMPYYQ